MQTFLIDTATGTWYNAAGGRFLFGSPTIPAGARDEIRIILVTGRAAQYDNAPTPEEAWPRDTTYGDCSAVLTVDADFLHRQRGELSSAVTAGAESLTITIPDLIPTALPQKGNIRLFDNSGTAESVAYDGFTVTGNEAVFNLTASPAREYAAGATGDAPQLPYCFAEMSESKSEPGNGLFVFDLVADSTRLRAEMAQLNRSALPVAGLEFLLMQQDHPAQSFLLTSFRLTNTLHAWEGDAPPEPEFVSKQLPELVEDMLPAVVEDKLPAVVEDMLPAVVEDQLPQILEEQRAKIVKDVLAALPTWDGGAY